VKTKSLLLLALAAAMVALPAAAFGHAARGAANSATFQDSTGEDPNAPDITSVAVSNTDAGLITFKININNRPALTSDMSVLLFMDTDQSSSTGDPQGGGTDYVIELDPGQVGLFKWNGSDYAFADSQSSLTFAYDATGATIRVSAADLGRTKALKLVAVAVSGIVTAPNGDADISKAHFDYAPDPGHGFYAYQVTTKLTLSVLAFTTSPKPAKAGKPFIAGLAVNESDTDGPVKSGTIACNASIGSKHVSAAGHAVTNGIAACLWRIPANAKGKTIHGTVTLTVQGTKVTRAFAVKIS